jgi:quercetin dioxygenase-like cupin family protein
LIYQSDKNKKGYISMKRRHLIWGILAFFPLRILARINTNLSAQSGKGFKVNAGQARFGEHYKMKCVTLNNLDIKISSKDTNGAFAVFEQTGLTPRGGPPLHIHPLQDEWFYVIEGSYLYQLGQDKYELSPGDTIFLPRNIQHAFIQLSEKGKMIVSYSPAGKMEAFFKVTDKWISPPSQDEIVNVFKEHDMKVVGPPLKID